MDTGKFIYKLATSDSELRAGFEVRRQVFIEEQVIPENLVFDGHDKEVLHIIVKDKETVIGTARASFLAANQVKLERMAVLKPFRGKGVGRRMISFLNEELRNRHVEQVVLHAQYEVTEFYESCGFKQIGSPFWEAGIKHIEMQRIL